MRETLGSQWLFAQPAVFHVEGARLAFSTAKLHFLLFLSKSCLIKLLHLSSLVFVTRVVAFATSEPSCPGINLRAAAARRCAELALPPKAPRAFA